MKILLATTSQFGYLVDYYRYYTYLKKNGHEVKYVCYYNKREKIEGDNPDIIYVPRSNNMLIRHFKLVNAIKREEKKGNYDRIMVHYFPLILLLLLYVKKSKMFIDIRTVSIHKKRYKRIIFDSLICIASVLYKNTSVITKEAAERIGIKKYKLLPWEVRIL